MHRPPAGTGPRPTPRQTVEQNTAVLFIAVLDRFHLVAAIERGLRGDLRQRRNRDRKILLQPVDAAHQRSGATSQPTRQPVMQKYLENEFTTITVG